MSLVLRVSYVTFHICIHSSRHNVPTYARTYVLQHIRYESHFLSFLLISATTFKGVAPGQLSWLTAALYRFCAADNWFLCVKSYHEAQCTYICST